METKLPEGWKHVNLRQVVSNEKNSFKRGPFGSAIKKEYFVPSGYKVYEQKNAIYNDFEIGSYYIDDLKFKELSDFEVKAGDIIISCSGTVGKMAIAPENIKKGIINQALLKITLDREKIDPKYFFYLFSYNIIPSKLTTETHGSAIKNISSVNSLKQIPFLLPPLETQRRIVEILDWTDGLRAKRQFALTLIDAIAQSIFLDMFGDHSTNPKGWAMASIGELIEPVETWNPLRTIPDDEFEYIDIGSIDQSAKKIGEPKKLKCADAPSRARQLVRSGDILVSTVRPNLNAVAIVSQELDGATASTGFCVLRPNKALLVSQYLFAWVKSNAFVSEMVSRATGASYPAVTDKIIYSSVLYLPPILLQSNFARRMDAIEKLKTANRASLAKLDALFASLQNHAFRGEL